MKRWQLGRGLLLPLFMLALTAGCQDLHVYRPMGVLVQDAETKRPIPRAQVALSYPLARESYAPQGSSTVAGEDGVARLRATAYREYGVQLQASAQGYLNEEKNVTLSEIEKIPLAHLFEDVERRPAAVVVEVFAEPRFTVELLIPPRYHGLVKAEVQIRDDAPLTPGQRCFRYEVSQLGEVQVSGPTVLRRIAAPEYQARDADGNLLTQEMTSTRVGFRWLRTTGNEQCYVVGTQLDYDLIRHQLLGDDRKPPGLPEPGQGGGQHGRHHRGGAPGS